MAKSLIPNGARLQGQLSGQYKVGEAVLTSLQPSE